MNTAWIKTFGLKGLILLVLLGGLYVLHGYVADMRTTRAQALAALEAQPNTLLEAARQQSDLTRRQTDIGRIDALIVERSEVVSVVALIEQEAQARNLIISVPTIEELRVVNERGEDVTAAAPAIDVRLDIAVDGDPSQIVAFVHSLEHLPYLLFLESWTLANRLPDPAAPVGSPPPARSDLSIILAVENPNG